jgi:lysozyme
VKLPHRGLVFIVVILLAGMAGFLIWSGRWIPNHPSKATYPVRGIDVSHHQGDIQWEKVAAFGIHFAYIKATEGADYKDRKFSQNWAGARAAQVVPGAYHFFTLGVPGARQAENFIATAPSEKVALPPAVDLEISGYNFNHAQPPQEFQQELARFTDTVATIYGKPPVIYTTPDFQRQYLKGFPVERLWIREVVVRPSQHWMFWQFSPRGQVGGITTFVDLNVFSGDRASFDALLQIKR